MLAFWEFEKILNLLVRLDLVAVLREMRRGTLNFVIEDRTKIGQF